MPDGVSFPDVTSDGSTAYQPDYRRCTQQTDCDTTNGEVCDRTYPGGMCHRSVCGTSTECGVLGICSENRGCIPRCTLQSDTCTQYGGICLAFAVPFEANQGCYPSCNPAATMNDPDGGMRACTNMLQCDPYRSECVATPASSGAINGAPCVDDGDCRSGLCIPEVDDRIGLRPTGFLRGYCTSYAPLPTEATFAAASGMNMPTSNCPPGNVVLPNPAAAPGSATRCLAACTADAQCREGYFCDKQGGGTATYANGACTPIDCAQAGRMCPSTTSCRMADGDAGALFNGSRCVRDTDGGASDGGSDAAADGANDASADGASDASAMDASAG